MSGWRESRPGQVGRCELVVPGAVDRGCCPHYQEKDTVVPGKMRRVGGGGDSTAIARRGQPSRTEDTAEEGGCFSLLPSSMPTGPGSHVHVHGHPPRGGGGARLVPATFPPLRERSHACPAESRPGAHCLAAHAFLSRGDVRISSLRRGAPGPRPTSEIV